MRLILNGNKGISIVEILVIVAIISTALVSLLGLTTFSLRVSNSIRETTQANSLAQEVIEAVRNFRDGTTWQTDGLGTLTTGLAYHPEKSGDAPAKWILISGEETINGFTRKVVFADVYRDSLTDDIEIAGDYLDTNTKKATITISWQDKTEELVTYLTNWSE